RSAVPLPTEIIHSLDCASGQTFLRQPACPRVNVPGEPMREETSGRVRIINDQDQAFRFLWNAVKLERRIIVSAFAGILCWNVSTVGKGGALNGNLRFECWKRETEPESGGKNGKRLHWNEHIPNKLRQPAQYEDEQASVRRNFAERMTRGAS